VLDDVSLSIRGGEIVALVGRSGSGKTTFLRLINRLMEPDAGEVIVGGRPAREWDPIELRRQTGYVIQPSRVTNTGTAAINGWTVTVTLPAGHAITGSWNATSTTSGQVVTFHGVSFNSNLAPGASGEFGFQASRPNGNTALPTATCTTP